jgi:hypothetical protein
MSPPHIAAIFALILAQTASFISHSNSALLVNSSDAEKPLNAANLCAAIESQAIELEPQHALIAYQYETLIFEYSGVEATDTVVEINEKVRQKLDVAMPLLLCKPVNFVPQNGNILKLAVSRQVDSFIVSTLNDWKIDLNQIDETDDSTVLDYIKQKISDAGANANLARIYTRYYDRFRASGAKHAVELRK